MSDEARADRLMDELVAGREAQGDLKLFALLDMAREPALLEKVKEQQRKCCLYRNAGETLERAAPWLVDLDGGGSAFLADLLAQGWGQSQALFLLSSASLGELRKHFRRFLQVWRESGQKLYFRFNDPRVARAFLPTCTRDELDFVFGPVSEFLSEGSDPKTLLRFTLDEEEGLVREVVQLDEARSPAQAEGQGVALPPELAELLTQLGQGGDSADLSRVRDALLVSPGQPALVGWLTTLGAKEYPDALASVDPLLEALLELGVQVEQPDALEPHLVGFADTSSWKPAFATLVPRLQGWSSGEARAQILRGCDAVIGLAEFGERIKDLRARLREMQQAPEPLQEQAALAEARATLRELDERSAPWPDEDARVGKLKRALPRLRERLEQRPSARSAASAFSTLLVGLGRGDDQDSARVARALQAALQGTRAGDGATAAPASAPEEAEPAPLPGRYTMRRKSIPFQRSRLVIRDEQMQALAAAQRRDLAVRLEAHARDERGAHERWGEERTHEIVAQCLDRAAELEISKFGAIRTLLDVMIVVDPAFTELDEYAWAKDLLESDMLEPNSKPGLIWDQLEV